MAITWSLATYRGFGAKYGFKAMLCPQHAGGYHAGCRAIRLKNKLKRRGFDASQYQGIVTVWSVERSQLPTEDN